MAGTGDGDKDEGTGLVGILVLVALCGIVFGFTLGPAIQAWNRCAPGTVCGKATEERKDAAAAASACGEGCDTAAASARLYNAESLCAIQACGDHSLTAFLLPGAAALAAFALVALYWLRARRASRKRPVDDPMP